MVFVKEITSARAGFELKAKGVRLDLVNGIIFYIMFVVAFHK